MKITTANGFALIAAITSLAAASVSSMAQELAPGEYIVGSEQILSDNVINGPIDGQSIAGASAYNPGDSGGYSTESCSTGSDNYVGDMSCGEAGCGSSGGLRGRIGSGALTSRLSGMLGGAHCVGDIGNLERGYGRPDLFYNYYTSGQANQTNAQMYLSPLPVPPNVGHTFFTYQPFYPEEMLYWHKNRYHNYYDNGRGMNRTRAVYFAPPVRTAASNVYWNYLRLPR